MWTRTLLRTSAVILTVVVAVFTGGLILSPVACAQEAGAAPGPEATASVWTQAQWLRLDINGGRIVLASRRCGQTRLNIEPTEASPLRQSLAVDAQPGALVASFEATSADQTITLSVDARQQLTIARRASGGNANDLTYVQPPLGPVMLTIGADQPRKYSAASLWHLLMAEPVAREELLPVLTTIHPDWQLDQQLAAAESALISVVPADNRVQRDEWQAWVEQLADPSFARRNEADLALRAAGQAVVVHLRRLDPATLDREQRQRIAGILRAVSGSGADSPECVAEWLCDCQRVWLAQLSRPDSKARLAAAGHLSQLSGKPIAIDPAASNERQAQQVVELKALLSEH